MIDLKNYILEGLFDDNSVDKMSDKLRLEKIAKDIFNNGLMYANSFMAKTISEYEVKGKDLYVNSRYNVIIKKCDISEFSKLLLINTHITIWPNEDITRNWFCETIETISDKKDFTKLWIEDNIIGQININNFYEVTIGQSNDVSTIKNLNIKAHILQIYYKTNNTIENVIFNKGAIKSDIATLEFFKVDYSDSDLSNKLLPLINTNYKIDLGNATYRNFKSLKDVEYTYSWPKKYGKYFNEMKENLWNECDDICKLLGYDIGGNYNELILHGFHIDFHFKKQSNNNWQFVKVKRH
jgi:hypothetical protein